MNVPKVGLQLWTIREQCDRDLDGALRRVGAQGYDGVELFQLHGRPASELKALLDDAGLAVAGRHAGLAALEDELPQIAAELEVLGTDRVAISWIDPSELEEPEAAVDRVARIAERARASGLRLGFHNHWSEVPARAAGASFLDLLRGLPADLLWLELDLGWVWHAGGDPARELEATAGRCPLVHAKDYATREDRDDVPVGSGIVGYAQVLAAAVAAGAEWLIVEEDEVGEDPFGAVEQSLRFVRGVV